MPDLRWIVRREKSPGMVETVGVPWLEYDLAEGFALYLEKKERRRFRYWVDPIGGHQHLIGKEKTYAVSGSY